MSADQMRRPSFSSLPLRVGDPPYSAWGLYGPDDELGTLNLLTNERILSAAQEIRLGESIGLNLPMNVPEPPSHGRKGFHHEIISKAPRNVHDDTIELNTQCSTQWDGFRHYGYQATTQCYNGVETPEFTGPDRTLKLGIHSWCRKGVAGRGVLLDYDRYARSQNIEFDRLSGHAVLLEELIACARYQNVDFREGDILLIRFGWTKAYLELSRDERVDWSQRRPVKLIGVKTSKAMAEWLWNTGFAAVASDTVAFERQPFDAAGEPGGLEKIGLHEILLGGWGMPIGEMWDLEYLGEVCEREKRYSFFLSSMPLNIPGGVAGPSNAIAFL